MGHFQLRRFTAFKSMLQRENIFIIHDEKLDTFFVYPTCGPASGVQLLCTEPNMKCSPTAWLEITCLTLEQSRHLFLVFSSDILLYSNSLSFSCFADIASVMRYHYRMACSITLSINYELVIFKYDVQLWIYSSIIDWLKCKKESTAANLLIGFHVLAMGWITVVLEMQTNVI